MTIFDAIRKDADLGGLADDAAAYVEVVMPRIDPGLPVRVKKEYASTLGEVRAFCPPVGPPACAPVVVTQAGVRFRDAASLKGNILAVLSPGDVGVIIWAWAGVVRPFDKLNWQFVKVVTPKWSDYGWIAADYLKVIENAG